MEPTPGMLSLLATVSYHYRDSHYKFDTLFIPSYAYDIDFYTRKIVLFWWIKAQLEFLHVLEKNAVRLIDET